MIQTGLNIYITAKHYLLFFLNYLIDELELNLCFLEFAALILLKVETSIQSFCVLEHYANRKSILACRSKIM